METDFLGARLDITLLSFVAESIELFIFNSDKERLDLGNRTFTAYLEDSHGHRRELETRLDDMGGELLVTFPGLRVGGYKYEVWTADESGTCLLVSGRVGVMPTVRAEQIQEEAGERRRFNLTIPAVSGKRIELNAIASSLGAFHAHNAKEQAEDAAGYADDAEEAAKKAEEAAKKAEEQLANVDDVVSDIRKRAETELADAVSGALDSFREDAESISNMTSAELAQKIRELEDALDNYDELKKAIEKLREDIRGSVTVDEGGYIIIGGENTGVKIVGEAGKSPYVDDYGVCHYWDDDAQAWKEKRVRGEDGFSPYPSERGYWMIKDPVTGRVYESTIPTSGRDGVDGTAIIRHIVKSYDDIPQAGETCTGGHYYYVQQTGGNPQAIIRYNTQTAPSGNLSINGQNISNLAQYRNAQQLLNAITPYINLGVLSYLGYELIDNNNLRLYTTDGRELVISRDDDVILDVLEYAGEDGEGYAIYAWLEDAAGRGAWVQVGEKNDIATRSVYGLNKLGTDAIISDGAPVGVNEKGEMNVGTASYEHTGAVRVSWSGILTTGANVGMDAEKRLRVPMASVSTHGAVRISCADECGAEVVGFTAAGTLGARWGTAGKPGIFGVLRSVTATSTQAEVAVDSNHNLRVPLDPLSAVRWDATQGFITLKIGEGISTTSGALTVQRATSSLYGVVKLASSIDATGGVLPVETLKTFLYTTFAEKEKAITAEQLKEELDLALNNPQLGFIRQAELDEALKGLLTRQEADEAYQPKKGAIVMCYDKFADMPALEDQEPGILYFAPAP